MSEAEEHFGVNYFQGTVEGAMPQSPQMQDTSTLSPLFRASPSIKRLRNESPLGEIIPKFLSLFKEQMSSKMKSQLVNHLFKLMVEGQHGLQFLHFLHGDCIEKVTNGILALFHAGKENIVYQLERIIADKRIDMERMPFGLIDYNIRFFNVDSTVKLKMEEHYSVWQETMFAHFGHKWVSLNRGPMWQYDEEEELEDSDAVTSCDILAEALNSAGLVSEIIDASDNSERKNVDSNNVPSGDGSELVEVGSVDTEDDDATLLIREKSWRCLIFCCYNS